MIGDFLNVWPERRRFFSYYIGIKKVGGAAVLDRFYNGEDNHEFSELIFVDTEASEMALCQARPELRPAFEAARKVMFL